MVGVAKNSSELFQTAYVDVEIAQKIDINAKLQLQFNLSYLDIDIQGLKQHPGLLTQSCRLELGLPPWIPCWAERGYQRGAGYFPKYPGNWKPKVEINKTDIEGASTKRWYWIGAVHALSYPTTPMHSQSGRLSLVWSAWLSKHV